MELVKEKIDKDLSDRFEIVVHNPKAFVDLVFSWLHINRNSCLGK